MVTKTEVLERARMTKDGKQQMDNAYLRISVEGKEVVNSNQ